MLPSAAHEVHFNARIRIGPDGAMREAIDVEGTADLAIDSDQQVAIECGGDAERIVIGQQ